MGEELEIVENPELTDDQVIAVKSLQLAMDQLLASVVAIDQSGLALADAFLSIGIEIPRFVQPMVNQLVGKLPVPPTDI